MIHLTLKSAMADATPEACRSLLAEGINFIVAVEADDGRWFLLHATDIGRAVGLCYAWVDYHHARGASVWRLYRDGIDSRHCHIVTPDPWPEWEAA